jgi:SAM-dependent methyltransferase
LCVARTLEQAVWLYALTIFLSAFLLFQVQPLIGKSILPWFGGGPAVWTTCMLFFQVLLLAGYAYAHLVRTCLRERGQALVHLGLLVLAMVLLPIGPSAELKPLGGDNPTWGILLILGLGVGLPYFALSATSPLLQAWFSTAFPTRSPYRLYALSNVGSLLALATYPSVVEPSLRLRVQEGAWSALFAGFAILCAGCAIRAWRARPGALPVPAVEVPAASATPPAAEAAAAAPAVAAEVAAGAPVRPSFFRYLMWLLLPACGSVMLLAITNQMCSDVGVVPFLWVLPLALYLVSFILVFQSDRFYWRPVFWPLLGLTAVVILWLLYTNVNAAIERQILGYSGGLFVCCMVLHGELARLKPHPRYLTSFYLLSSAGGAVGGVLVTLVAPQVFKAYFELHIGVAATFALALVAFCYEWYRHRDRYGWWAMPLLGTTSLAAVVAVIVLLTQEAQDEIKYALTASRNFYGVLQVIEYNAENPHLHHYSLQHGRIMHGTQYPDSTLRYRPVTYYADNSGVGLAILHRRPGKPIRIGVVGLGTGTIAAYGGKGDVVRFYEINPEIRNLATTRFTYLADSAADCQIQMGDARLSLERDPPQEFDVLALDAFSGDAIPIHLLTREAFQIYLRHLKPDGVLAVHCSNRFLDLKPVVLAISKDLGLSAAMIDSGDWGRDEISACNWVLVTADKAFLESYPIKSATTDESTVPPSRYRLWTDDYSDLFSIMNWSHATRDTDTPAATDDDTNESDMDR